MAESTGLARLHIGGGGGDRSKGGRGPGRLREALATQQTHALNLVERHFPAGTRVTRPEGGYFLWLELPPEVDALALHQRWSPAREGVLQPLT